MGYPTEPQGLSTYDFLMEKVLAMTASNVGQEQVEQLMAIIAYHETGPDQRNLPEAEQVRGPGRGLYQYELQPSAEYPKASGAGRTAMNNLLTAVGSYDNLPIWAKKYFDIDNDSRYPNPSGDVDFSKLTEGQQKELFLADKLMDVNVKLSDIGVESDSLWWQKYHHKGGGDTAKFDSSRTSYLNNRR